jgi:type I restriction enzyme S subunit
LNSSAFWSWAAANFIQSTIQNISAEKYASLWIPCPPIEEQAIIHSYLANVFSELELHKKKVTLSISKLQEYRATLITAAVTGQIPHLN